MLRGVSWLSAPAVRLTLTLLSVVLLGLSWGHGGDLNDGLEALRSETAKSKQTILRLFKGEEAADPKNPQHQQAVDVAAKNATYYFTDQALEKKSGGFNDLFERTFEGDLVSLIRIKVTNPTLAPMYSRRIVVRGQEVLDSARQDVKPIARVNVTRVMARLAERGPNETIEDVVARLRGPAAAELADAMLKALTNKNDGVKYHALHGLRDLLAIPPQTPPLLPTELEQQCVLTLIEFIHRQPAYAANAPPEEVEGFRVLRREAVKALAQYRNPSIKDKALPALVLLKVVARDGFLTDPPGLDERVEAAIGIARMKPDIDKTYQPEYAAQQLGLFVVDFASNYQTRDRAVLKPWAVQAARLSDALEVLKASAKNPYVANVVDQGIRLVLRKIETKGDLDVNDLTNYNSILVTKPPVLGQLFSGREGTAVLSPSRKGDEPVKP